MRTANVDNETHTLSELLELAIADIVLIHCADGPNSLGRLQPDSLEGMLRGGQRVERYPAWRNIVPHSI